MKREVIFLLIFSLLITGSVYAKRGVKVTYISNEGFIIEPRGVKIAVDAIFNTIDGDWCDSPDKRTVNKIINALPPFDKINIIAVTHKHRDHFDSAILAKYLLKNRKVRVLCPDQVRDLLKAEDSYGEFKQRIISLCPAPLSSENIKIAGVEIKAVRLEHSRYMKKNAETGKMFNKHRNIVNLGYLFDIKGYKIFHCGDTNPLNSKEYAKFKLFRENINLAFLERMFFTCGKTGTQIINDLIRPGKIVVMHIRPSNRALFMEHFKKSRNVKVFNKKGEVYIL